MCESPVCAPRGCAPAPEVCWACAGTGGNCERCRGCGCEAARFDLTRTRTHELRRVRFEPGVNGLHRLFVWQLAKKTGWKVAPPWVEYAVCEFPCDFAGRAFRVEKVGTDRLHDVFLGFDGSAACDCEANCYLTSAKANQRAYEAGEEVFTTKGCIHTDCLFALVSAGWFDLT